MVSIADGFHVLTKKNSYIRLRRGVKKCVTAKKHYGKRELKKSDRKKKINLRSGKKGQRFFW